MSIYSIFVTKRDLINFTTPSKMFCLAYTMDLLEFRCTSNKCKLGKLTKIKISNVPK